MDAEGDHLIDEELLRPSLTSGRPEPIFSAGALVATAFFGGPLAVALLGAENSRRLGRLGRDGLIIVGLLLFGAISFLASLYLWPPDDDRSMSRNARIAVRLVAFGLVGCFYLLHRGPYRAMRATGTEPPSPWGPVIAAVFAGVGLNAALRVLVPMMFPGVFE